ncbi:hypothetical protein CPB85DRAFT_1012443 [Mucidula mucida]|nr:hypothetical protein CPB85DRAFT_1012443 [Mucidula mucida]
MPRVHPYRYHPRQTYKRPSNHRTRRRLHCSLRDTIIVLFFVYRLIYEILRHSVYRQLSPMSPQAESPPWRASVDQSTPLSSPTPPTSPNSDIITGSPDTSRLHAVNQSVLECFHLAMEGEEVPAMIAPCHEHPGMNRRTVFGMKLSVGRPRK